MEAPRKGAGEEDEGGAGGAEGGTAPGTPRDRAKQRPPHSPGQSPRGSAGCTGHNLVARGESQDAEAIPPAHEGAGGKWAREPDAARGRAASLGGSSDRRGTEYHSVEATDEAVEGGGRPVERFVARDG